MSAFGRERREEPRIEISSLVDVVFLLLIFFMVTTRFAEEPVVEIELPDASGETQQVEDDVSSLVIDPQGRIFLGGERVERSELEGTLRRRFGGEAAGDRKLRLDADRGATWRVMAHVFDACGKAGVEVLMAKTEPDAPVEDGS